MIISFAKGFFFCRHNFGNFIMDEFLELILSISSEIYDLLKYSSKSNNK